jgi:hypothetical protein
LIGVFPEDVRAQPHYCQYAAGTCDQDFRKVQATTGLFVYASEPATISHTVRAAIPLLRGLDPAKQWRSWREIPIAGQIIFCEICKALRFSDFVVSDVSTLNFNVLFEIGYALGLGRPVLPIRDSTYARDKREFDQLGLLDTLGYINFQNAEGLARAILERLDSLPAPLLPSEPNKEQPLYLVKSHIDTEGQIRLLSALKKSAFFFRTFDPKETARLSLHEAFRQTSASLAVVTHLLSLERSGARVHNARSAFLAGLAVAQGRHLLMLQEGVSQQPIDYRDIIIPYEDPGRVPGLVIRVLRSVATTLQGVERTPLPATAKMLEKVDVGDLAAENEIGKLRSYFVPTAQFNEAKRGNARLLVGRKGSGKTAIFYGVRDSYSRRRSHLVLDLKLTRPQSSYHALC